MLFHFVYLPCKLLCRRHETFSVCSVYRKTADSSVLYSLNKLYDNWIPVMWLVLLPKNIFQLCTLDLIRTCHQIATMRAFYMRSQASYLIFFNELEVARHSNNGLFLSSNNVRGVQSPINLEKDREDNSSQTIYVYYKI